VLVQSNAIWTDNFFYFIAKRLHRTPCNVCQYYGWCTLTVCALMFR